MKKKKLKPLKGLKKKADDVFGKWIRERDGHQCYTCMTPLDPKKSQCGHYVSRSYLALRYSEENCHTQCVGCNVFKKGNMDVYAIRLINQYGTWILKDFQRKKNVGVGDTRIFLNKIIEKYAKSTSYNIKNNNNGGQRT